MNPISMVSFEDLAKFVYRKGSIMILPEKNLESELANFPVDGATWTMLPEGTVLISGSEDKLTLNNKLTTSVLPKHTHNGDTGNAWATDGWSIDGSSSFNVGDASTASGIFANSGTYNPGGGGATGSLTSRTCLKLSISHHGHSFTTGDGGFSNNSLDTILKHPKCYFYRRDN